MRKTISVLFLTVLLASCAKDSLQEETLSVRSAKSQKSSMALAGPAYNAYMDFTNAQPNSSVLFVDNTYHVPLAYLTYNGDSSQRIQGFFLIPSHTYTVTYTDNTQHEATSCFVAASLDPLNVPNYSVCGWTNSFTDKTVPYSNDYYLYSNVR